MSQTIPKWTDERTAQLEGLVAGMTLVTVEVVTQAAEALSTSTRSISSKLRKMDYEVESTAAATGKTYTAEQEAEITEFLEANPNTYTYAEVAANVLGGSKTAKQIQGKVLSMELTSLVKPTPKVERAKTYTDDEEAKLLGLVNDGGFIEDIAEAMGKSVQSIRGKILSMSRTNEDITIPKQKNYKTKESVDPIEALGDVSEMTVADIASAIDKTERGVKTMLTHRGVTCKNYDGARKAEKIAESNA